MFDEQVRGLYCCGDVRYSLVVYPAERGKISTDYYNSKVSIFTRWRIFDVLEFRQGFYKIRGLKEYRMSINAGPRISTSTVSVPGSAITTNKGRPLGDH